MLLAASDRGDTLQFSGVTDDLSSPDGGRTMSIHCKPAPLTLSATKPSRDANGMVVTFLRLSLSGELKDEPPEKDMPSHGSCNPTTPFVLGVSQGVDFGHFAKHSGYLKDRTGEWGTESQGSKSSSFKRHA